MSFPRLESLADLDGARVLVRLDLNVPLKDGVVQDATRIEAALPTLRWLLERSGVVAVCSHLGKPKGAVVSGLSLEPVTGALAEAIGRPVTFVPASVGDEVVRAVEQADDGALILLETLRFNPGESKNDRDFARSLAAPFDAYVNDAFGTAHRAHASVAAIPELFAPGKKAAGRLMEAELDALGRLLTGADRPFTAVIGGAKVSTKTAPLEALLEKVDHLAIGGGMANTFMLAQGLAVGRSLVEVDMVDTASAVIERAKQRGVELLMPTDVVVTDAIDNPTSVRVIGPTEVAEGDLIVDIGPTTRTRYAEAVRNAAAVFWNGPMGVFEVDAFAAGTLAVAEALTECAGFTVVGGGESVMAVHRAGVADEVRHVSTGGGASLELISGERLPAVAALESLETP